MLRKLLLILMTAVMTSAFASQLPFKYRLRFVDKAGSYELLEQPHQLLSSRALERRTRNRVEVDTTDLPVSAIYMEKLRGAGFHIVSSSRWMNSVVVESDKEGQELIFKLLPFVKDAKLVWKSNGTQPSMFVEESYEENVVIKDARRQLEIHNGQKLHEAGYRGEGMLIAVIDGGFLNTDLISMINQNVVGYRDFADPDSDFYLTHPHGTMVLSTMASNDSGTLPGSAPNANYWLLRSEDSSSEFPVEEDYWIAAAEYADSLGVDIINSSLGYFMFDDPSMDYTWEDLDGKTAFITQGANMAASKGMLVVNSAGNERNKYWERISFPADSPDILTLGAINPYKKIASFSGAGFTGPFVKPDVMAVGDPAYLCSTDGVVRTGTGTSFSSPVMAGLLACLWQALPQLTSREMIALARECSDRFATPDSLYGYGIPDLYEALSRYPTPLPALTEDSRYTFQPFDTSGYIWSLAGLPYERYRIEIFNFAGQMMDKRDFKGSGYILNLNNLPTGLYIVNLQSDKINCSQRINIDRK